MVNQLTRVCIKVEQQIQLKVYDEDGTWLGDLTADVLVEGVLLLELKAVKQTVSEHVAQLLGYLKACAGPIHG